MSLGLARALDSRGGDKEQQEAELKKAEDLASKASDHEQRYIRADVAGAKKKDDDAEAAYATQMEALIDRYPDDLDARWARRLLPRSEQCRAQLVRMRHGEFRWRAWQQSVWRVIRRTAMFVS